QARTKPQQGGSQVQGWPVQNEVAVARSHEVLDLVAAPAGIDLPVNLRSQIGCNRRIGSGKVATGAFRAAQFLYQLFITRTVLGRGNVELRDGGMDGRQAQLGRQDQYDAPVHWICSTIGLNTVSQTLLLISPTWR